LVGLKVAREICNLAGAERALALYLDHNFLKRRYVFGRLAIDRPRRQQADKEQTRTREDQSSHLSRVRCCTPGSAQSLAWLPFCQACRLQSQSSKSLTILPGVPDPPVRYFFQS